MKERGEPGCRNPSPSAWRLYPVLRGGIRRLKDPYEPPGSGRERQRPSSASVEPQPGSGAPGLDPVVPDRNGGGPPEPLPDRGLRGGCARGAGRRGWRDHCTLDTVHASMAAVRGRASGEIPATAKRLDGGVVSSGRRTCGSPIVACLPVAVAAPAFAEPLPGVLASHRSPVERLPSD